MAALDLGGSLGPVDRHLEGDETPKKNRKSERGVRSDSDESERNLVSRLSGEQRSGGEHS